MTFDELWEEAEKITGFLFKEEGQALYDCTMEIPENGVVVELGCYCGKSSRVIVEAVKQRRGKLYSVDSFVDGFDGVPTIPGEALRQYTKHVLNPFYDYTELIKKNTLRASKFFTQPIDFLFIDADHSFDWVTIDCKEWLPKLKSGGLVAFHDYNSEGWADVKKASAPFIGGWHNVRNDFSVAVFRKP